MTDQARSRIDEMLAEAREHLDRLSATEAHARHSAGRARLIDTRTAEQRSSQGDVPGALVIDRTVLEWRLAPPCPWRIPEATGPALHVVVLCRHGYPSSLAAASLQAVGLHRATDVIGGVEAWIAAGLPVHTGPADVRT